MTDRRVDEKEVGVRPGERTVFVTRTYMPDLEAYTGMLRGIWASGQVTNNGPLCQELESALLPHHGTRHVLLMGNGTITLQIAIRALEVGGEVITTPFSYVASTTAVLWEQCTPVFADIAPDGFNIDPSAIEAAITPRTTAVLATHVYGLPCDVEAIERIARRHGLKVIYDAAHAFGTLYRGRPLLSYGDVSSCSFHATKIFHTVEGGSVACNDAALYDRMRLMRSFGHIGDAHHIAGINGKNSELHAAMGLLVLARFKEILERRREQWERYAACLSGVPVRTAHIPAGTQYNHAYFPVVLPNEAALLAVVEALGAIGVMPRRYFYPALNTLPYVNRSGGCPVAEDVARRVLCLPLYHDLSDAWIERIAEVLNRTVR
ncbi:MAG: DegT/DnrJ/EryC1/StrS family aminotransferase [Flavobacteriales bacterium]|nr:DegT/DnrJ/EryC1/StrS family aminotransferase [Flavobacteriales bacterium]